MLKVYEVYHKHTGFRDDDRAFVAAESYNKAKALAIRTPSCKFYGYEYENMRARRDASLDEMLTDNEPPMGIEPFGKITEPRWLFDNETYEDTLDAERRWFDSQCL